jgi:hypothetical protein
MDSDTFCFQRLEYEAESASMGESKQLRWTRLRFHERFKDATIGFSGYARLLKEPENGVSYMALLLLIVLSISCVIMTNNVRLGLMDLRPRLAQAPDFSLVNGEVHYTGKMPFEVKDANGNAVLILDTTGQTTIESLAGKKNVTLIGRNYMYQVSVSGNGTITNFQQPGMNQISVTKQGVQAFVNKDLQWLTPVVYIFIYGFQLGAKALDALILGLVALIAANAFGQKIPLATGYKLGLYAISLPTLIQWVWPGFSTLTFTGFVIWWALAIIYTVMGLRASFRDPISLT